MKSPMSSEDGPGSLFIDLWLITEILSPVQRTLSQPPATPIQDAIAHALRQEDGAIALAQLQLIREAAASKDDDHKTSVVLEIMRQIDAAFYEIHPRARSTPNGKSNPRRAWVTEALVRRIASGCYAEQESRRLIARGPLLREPRGDAFSSGDSLADRFASIEVVRSALSQEGCEISISHKVLQAGGHKGVRLGSKEGREKIGFLAVAQNGAEIVVTHEVRNDRNFLDFKAAACINVSERIIEGLEQIGSTDIAMAPELVVSESDADLLRARLPNSTASARIFLAGTGHTRAADTHSMAWNEAQIVNEHGVVLWRQRKFWQACTKGSRAIELGVSLPADVDCFEYNVSDNCLVVVDVEALGRCVVLICQDFTAQPIVSELIRTYQPDWVLVPIMDKDVSKGRWAHQCAFGASGNSRARFLMVTNTAYARKMGLVEEVVMALAVGPMHEDSIDKGRLCAALTPVLMNGVEIATVEWGSGAEGNWQTSTLGAR